SVRLLTASGSPPACAILCTTANAASGSRKRSSPSTQPTRSPRGTQNSPCRRQPHAPGLTGSLPVVLATWAWPAERAAVSRSRNRRAGSLLLWTSDCADAAWPSANHALSSVWRVVAVGYRVALRSKARRLHAGPVEASPFCPERSVHDEEGDHPSVPGL